MTAEDAMEKIGKIVEDGLFADMVFMARAGVAIGRLERIHSDIKQIVETYEKTKPRYEVMAFCDNVLCSLGQYRRRKDAERVWSSISRECYPYIVDLEEKNKKRKRKRI